ncbi:PPP4R2-domain-containing protein [Lentinula raphanica]|uniref:PPP4R2-domain-containing protein n=1 Tax=Lentinula raphanica TaxID=153919 RepID=A0AA38UL19_9AGAR|nr:PPP4R2-domain-containing protein [Lentinula raphanica]
MSSDASQFEWKSDYQTILEQIADSDIVDVKWDLLKNIIKCKIEQNISIFLRNTAPPSPTPTFELIRMPNGGIKIPPFPPRQQNSMTVIEAPIKYMNEEQASAMKDSIFAQLDTFDSNAPFTIQRVCELCVEPKKHYQSIGKYLRAVEKSILVTSTWADFPPLTEEEKNPILRGKVATNSPPPSIPNTPLFSPIPFLHNDARRSKSRSPPPSPLALSSSGPMSGGHPETLSLEPQALGLVDELDDPRPGHMSDHPTALTAVTTVDDGSEGAPIVQSLDSRFVKAEDDDAAMAVDENKENESTQ